ncbi:MAG: hypothetical protein Q9162_001180 [Coniocarpon cinnabarinum]
MSLFGGPVGPSSPPTSSPPPPASPSSSSPAAAQLSSQSPSVSSENDAFETDAEEEVLQSASPVPVSERRSNKSIRRWQRQTRPYRDIFNAIQREENDDLSIHLFNAHVLKRRTYEPEYRGQNDHYTQTRAKRRLRSKEEWTPSRKWTAWPLKLQDLPLESERWGEPRNPEQTLKARMQNVHSARPSDELREVMVAEAVRMSRSILAQLKHEQKNDVYNDTRQSPRAAEASDSDSSDVSTSQQSEASMETERNERPSSDTAGRDYTPTPPLDDEVTEKALQPIISSTLADLDRLLCALYHPRPINPQSRGNDTGTVDGSIQEYGGDGSGVSTGNLTAKRRSNKANPRDWSEVLGLASQLGWPESVVKAAQRRCEGLFGEQMTFQSVSEEGRLPAESTKTTTSSLPREESDAIPSIETGDFLPRSSSKAAQGWKCPEAACSEKRKFFSSREEWLHHIESAHGYTYHGAETVVEMNGPQHGVNELCCPDPDCQRHEWPFPTQWRLNEHMKRSHGATKTPRLSSSPSSARRSTTPDVGSTADAMFGTWSLLRQ